MNEAQPYDPDQRREEAMVDQSGFTIAQAHRRFEDSPVDPDKPVASGKKTKRRKGAIYRGGRATVPGESGRNIADQEAQKSWVPDTDVIRAARVTGVAAARAAMLEAKQPKPLPAHDPEEMKRRARESFGD